MDKTLVGYCSECRKKTKQTVVCCEKGLAWRIFENVVSAGLLGAFGYNYDCECTVCKSINTIHK